ncbi:MAG: hypothetical protein JST84_04915 [Acidobacteria bacterium]|nr:hypothetical protein [Acidobacteriota bacterium]
MLHYQIVTQLDLTQLRRQGICALDIEMASWRVPSKEWISLVQLAWRNEGDQIEVAVLDGKEKTTKENLRPILSDPNISIVVHNAAYDINKLQKHWGLVTESAFCTMSAARKAGEKKYSLQALASKFLSLELDKTEQTSSFSQRPLRPEQIAYAARDAACTLILWEYQQTIGWRSSYEAKPSSAIPQATSQTRISTPGAPATPDSMISAALDVSSLAAAICDIIAFMPGKFSPERLVVNITNERSGYLGFVLDSKLGDIVPDEKEVLETLQQLEQSQKIRVEDRRYHMRCNRLPNSSSRETGK